MKNIAPRRRVLFASAFCALMLTSASWSQIVEFRATLNAAQETPASTSPATGTAIMFYNVATNKFDLLVSINSMANTATASHVHQGAPGVAGDPVNNLGGESVYTRTGNNLSLSVNEMTYFGDKVTLLRGGAYYNIHSSQFPGGEIRGQLIPRPVRLVSKMDVPQEQAAFPNVNLSGLNDFGAAVMVYDPMSNQMNLRLSIFNFNNTFNNSHFHAGAPGVSGGVVVNLGNNANAGIYSTPPAPAERAPGFISGSVDNLVMAAANGTPIDPIALLTGGLYLNFHSTTFGGGELRGQVHVSNELATTRLSNLSVRGFVGQGEQALIQGFTVSGPDPIRVVLTAKGPSLSAFGIANPAPNPRIALHDSASRLIALNEDIGAIAAGSELSRIPGIPTNTLESALVVVLPPGNYTAVVGAIGGTGIALLEIADLRNLLGLVTSN